MMVTVSMQSTPNPCTSHVQGTVMFSETLRKGKRPQEIIEWKAEIKRGHASQFSTQLTTDEFFTRSQKLLRNFSTLCQSMGEHSRFWGPSLRRLWSQTVFHVLFTTLAMCTLPSLQHHWYQMWPQGGRAGQGQKLWGFLQDLEKPVDFVWASRIQI